MNAWISEIPEVVATVQPVFNFSLPDLSIFMPDARVFWVVAAAIAFCVVAGCHEAWFNDNHDRQ
jgi:hypothetical protein